MVRNQTLPLVGVIGCTGKQGSSITRSLLQSDKFSVRGLCSNTNSQGSKKLLQMRDDLIPKDSNANLDIMPFDELDEHTYEPALIGLDFLFAMTTPNPEDPEEELRAGKRLTDWSLKLGIKHVIWSSLPNAYELTNGQLDVPHFTMKARVQGYMRQKGLPFTAVLPGFFLSNLYSNGMLPFTKLPNGSWTLRLPLKGNTKLPLLDVENDVGPVILNILENREQYEGKSIPLYSEELSLMQLCDKLSHQHNAMVKFEQLDADKLLKTPFSTRDPPLPDEVIRMMMYFDKFGYYGGLNLEPMRKMMKLQFTSMDTALAQRDALLA